MSKTINYFIANTIYGTIGLFLHYVNASSEFVVLCRGAIGSLFIILIMFLTHDLPDIKAIKANFKTICLSGMLLGFNWIFLFAGYKYGVAVTSLCNYMAPIFIVIISSIFFKEKLSRKHKLCILGAFIGIVFVSGVLEENAVVDYHCVVYGLLAAIGFVVLVLCNRNIHDIKPLDKTVSQLFVSALTVFPYVLINKSIPTSLDTRSIIMIVILCVVHTAIAYILYFNSIDVLPVNEVAILGYIEPVLSVLIGNFLFNEPMSILGYIGAVLIITSALINELP